MTCITDISSFPSESLEQRGGAYVHRTHPLLQWSPQLINVETIRHIEAVKSSQVNFTRIHFADFATTMDVLEKYEEVKMLLSQAHLVLQAVEQSDSAHAAYNEQAA